MNPKRSTTKHITMEKLRILEMTKEKKITSADTSAETLWVNPQIIYSKCREYSDKAI